MLRANGNAHVSSYRPLESNRSYTSRAAHSTLRRICIKVSARAEKKFIALHKPFRPRPIGLYLSRPLFCFFLFLLFFFYRAHSFRASQFFLYALEISRQWECNIDVKLISRNEAFSEARSETFVGRKGETISNYGFAMIQFLKQNLDRQRLKIIINPISAHEDAFRKMKFLKFISRILELFYSEISNARILVSHSAR